MSKQTKNFYAFGPFRFDPEELLVWRDRRPIPLAPKVVETLHLLLQNAGHLVEKDELMKGVWPDAFVEEGNLNKNIFILRKTLGRWDSGLEYIETLPKRGYRFVAPVKKVFEDETSSSLVPAAESNLVGKKVSHYRVLEILGGGGMGLVYKAEDLKLGRRVALKFLPEELTGDAVALERFEREARAASALNHPSICTIHAIEEHEKQPFLAMELLEGETLRELISAAVVSSRQISDQEGPLQLDKLLDIAIQVTGGLEAAHQKGIIHRDIKPANVFVTSQGQAKILDFGLAKLQEADAAEPQLSPIGEKQCKQDPNLTLTRTGVTIGTAGYMSPEQVRGDKLDTRTDLFSFGMVLYEMATGQRAFAGDTAPMLREAILNHTPKSVRELNSKIPPQLERIINKTLEKDREARYQTALEMRVDLQCLAQDRPLRHFAPTRYRSKGWKLAAIAAGILAALVLVASLTWRFGQNLFPPTVIRSVAVLPLENLTGKRAMAVIEIENLSHDPSLNWLGDGVVDLLTTDLAQARNLDVISSERVRSLISREVKPDESLPASKAQQVAQKAGAEVFVSGGLLKMGQGFRLNLRVQDTATGKILLADKVEGDSPQAIFSMVDQATERIVSKLTPTEASVQPSSLTSNLDALRAYEEGLSYFLRVFNDRAAASFRRAIELDPQFAMAYYQLAQMVSEPSEKRRTLAQAAQLAQSQGLPEQQKLLIRATQLQNDGRWEESTQTFQMIVRQFPKEIGPRISLGLLLRYQGKLSEAAAVLEAAQLDDPNSILIYNPLAYTYAFQGDLSRALAAVDKYAAVLPPNDPNPIDTRADIYAIGGQFDKAIAEYEKNVESHPKFGMPEVKIALVYLLAGKNQKAEETARSAHRKASGTDRAYSADALGNIALGCGAFSRAANYFEEAAQLFRAGHPYSAQWELWKAGEIHFEEREPQAALAWARRTPGFGAAEVRGVAYLLSKNELAAEKEFAAARTAMAPVFGEYMGEKLIAFDRLRAASYAGQWQHVIDGWPELPGWLGQREAFFLGRAYAETAMWPEAEKELRIALVGVGPGNLAIHDFLCYELTQFYLGNVLEQEGKKAEAIEAYRAFLSHFEHSTARLPEIGEARAALHRLK